ncbi:hypothetical protein [Agaribacterium sp. ZY112]|uniref:hypothetical protein n=1 Tax=Agaribacterium sp. ZY112 TaxID=3233574 RepID=UPI0035234389
MSVLDGYYDDSVKAYKASQATNTQAAHKKPAFLTKLNKQAVIADKYEQGLTSSTKYG